MVVKLIAKDKKEVLYPCNHIEVTHYLPGSVALAGFCELQDARAYALAHKIEDHEDVDTDSVRFKQFREEHGVSEDSAAGIEIQMIDRSSKNPKRSVLLPRDAEVAYVTNDNGSTVGIYRWPPEQEKQDVKLQAQA